MELGRRGLGGGMLGGGEEGMGSAGEFVVYKPVGDHKVRLIEPLLPKNAIALQDAVIRTGLDKHVVPLRRIRKTPVEVFRRTDGGNLVLR